jgi:polar amino acid transport system permease protein
MIQSLIADPGKLEIVPPRRWATKALAVVSVVAVVFVIRAFWQGDIAWQYVSANLFAPAVLSGVVNTIIMTFCAMALGIVLGVIAAMMRMSDNGVLRSLSIGYVWLFRGIPALLQLLLWFNLALIFPTIGLPGVF